MHKLNAQEHAAALRALPQWRHDAVRDAIRRRFEFANFTQAFAFMSAVAQAAEIHNHHPEWSNVYHWVDVTWTTHDVDGLSDLDLLMAQVCERAAADIAAPAGAKA